MHKDFQSIYAPYLKKFYEYKKSLGYKYNTGWHQLQRLDAFAKKEGEYSHGITKEFALKWNIKSLNESGQYHFSRVSILSEFSEFLCDLGIESFIPRLPKCPKSTFIPYIFSDIEVKAIFSACDNLRQSAKHNESSLFSLPALIRLLYSTGLRINEAVDLKDEDVNVDEGWLMVRDSKNGKERIIPISDSLVIVCKEYRGYRDQLPLIKKRPENFFVKLNGDKCSIQAIRKWFQKALVLAFIPTNSKGLYQRMHDLRHTFAVSSLRKMAESGIDLYASLPVLSTYLGHQNIESTNLYVRLTAQVFPELITDVDKISLNVFPKLNNYEND